MSLKSIGANVKPHEVKFIIELFNSLLITRFVQIDPNIKHELFMKLDEDFIIELLISSISANSKSDYKRKNLMRITNKILFRLNPRLKFRYASRLEKLSH